DLFAIKTGDFVVTEAGFGADLGAEKFFNIKCRYSGLTPDASVLVVTVRALKMHGGVGRIVPGKPLPPEILEENLEAVKRGSENMIKQIENIKIHGVPVVVAINLFPDDHDSEVELIRKIAIDSGAEDAVVSEVFSKGGEGGIDLAKAVIKASEKGSNFKFLYPLEASIEEKIERIAVKIYGAKKVSYSKKARRKIKLFSSLGYDKLPICMAKTHLSLSHDPNLKGRPEGFDFPIEDIRLSSGAGFLVPLAGDIRTMPGLPSVPSGNFIDIDDDGNAVGLH
ncbi:MAG: formate--tetrahydrofolate ligase, partial [Caldiserica bacterium]